MRFFAAAGALVLFLTSCQQSKALPILFPVPAVTLTTEKGQALNLGDLKGKVAVYDFIFTRCAATCPIMSASMRSLTGKVASPEVRFVSVSVDPDHDTPEVLREYAERLRNDDRWIFLTGKREDVVDLSVKGFKLAAGDPGLGAEPILHSSKFVVVDRSGMIRGYYDGTSAQELDRLARDVQALLRST